MLSDRNYWATYKNPLVRWHGEMPPPADLGMERVFEFTHHILLVAEREQFMHVLESPRPYLFKSCAGQTWLGYVYERFKREGALTIFPGGGPTHQRNGGRLRLPARLAYYRGTRIVEEDVEDPGLLLRELQHPDPVTNGIIGRYSTPPFWLDGGAYAELNRAPGKPPIEPLHVSFGLFTDIWFPRVIGANAGDGGGCLDEVHPARGRDLLMDNSSLAARHTPRLNRFIETLRDTILELGGTWSFDREETDSRYLPMLHDGGINLDPPVADA